MERRTPGNTRERPHTVEIKVYLLRLQCRHITHGHGSGGHGHGHRHGHTMNVVNKNRMYNIVVLVVAFTPSTVFLFPILGARTRVQIIMPATPILSSTGGAMVMVHPKNIAVRWIVCGLVNKATVKVRRAHCNETPTPTVRTIITGTIGWQRTCVCSLYIYIWNTRC